MLKDSWLSQEDYDFIFDRVPRLCIDLVIIFQEKILLSLRDIDPYRGLWHLPGGMVYKQESVYDAAKRIAKKETGLEIKIDRFVGYMEFFHEIQNSHDRHTTSIVLAAYPENKDLKMDYQSKKLRFHSFLPKNIVAQHKNLLAKHRLFN